jgi:hypothetical protein
MVLENYLTQVEKMMPNVVIIDSMRMEQNLGETVGLSLKKLTGCSYSSNSFSLLALIQEEDKWRLSAGAG